MLAMVVLAIVALVWQWADQHPLLALFVIPSTLYGLYRLGKHEQAKRQAILDARLRDEHVPSMSPLEYEQFVARQLERAGWTVKHCGRQGDQGADVVADLRGFRAVVQVKLYRKRCGNDAVQQISAARRHYDAQIMVVVCPAGFTPSAVALASSNGVHLMDHSALASLATAARIP